MRNYAEVERLASQLIELSTLHNFAFWLAGAEIFRGWARSFRGDIKDGLAWIDTGIGDYLATGATLGMPSWLGLKAEALHLADRTAEALQTVNEAIVLIERFEERSWLAELYRLRGVFLAAVQTDKAQIEASFSAAINTAKQQNSRSLAIRAEESYRAYSHVRDASRDNS